MKKWGILSKLLATFAIVSVFVLLMGVSFALWVMFIKLCLKF